MDRQHDFFTQTELQLCNACISGSLQDVSAILDGNPGLERKDMAGRGLHAVAQVAEGSRSELVQALLAHGASVDTLDFHDMPPLYRALDTSSVNFEVVKVLLDNKATFQYHWSCDSCDHCDGSSYNH